MTHARNSLISAPSLLRASGANSPISPPVSATITFGRWSEHFIIRNGEWVRLAEKHIRLEAQERKAREALLTDPPSAQHNGRAEE